MVLRNGGSRVTGATGESLVSNALMQQLHWTTTRKKGVDERVRAYPYVLGRLL